MNIANLLHQAFVTIVPFTILLGILIFVHELGHFAVARWCGVRVEVFSMGFGKKILSIKRGATTYCLSIIPLGGYVKMFGEQNGDVVTPEHEHESFTHKNVWQRIAIVLAGPLMNFFFAVLVFALIAGMGEETRAPIVAEVEVGSAAEQMGLKTGDRVTKVNSEEIRSYEEFQKALNQNKNSTAKAFVLGADGQTREVTLNVGSTANPNIFSTEKTVGDIPGILPLARGTIVGVKSGSIAEKAGFKPGDEITEVNGKKVTRWGDLATALQSEQSAKVTVQRESENNKSHETLQLAAGTALENLGFEQPDLFLDQVVKDSPAAKAELQRYDRIVSIDGEKIAKWEQVLNKIKSFDGKDSMLFVINRNGAEIGKKITPQITSQMTMQGKEDRRYTIGIMPFINYAEPERVKVKSDNIFAAGAKGVSRTWDVTTMTIMSVVRMFQGELSHKNVGGMLSIGKAAKDSYQNGLQSFLITMGILSVSLFILNLLPIPVLDGGHLVFYFIEVIKGSPLSLKKMEVAQQVGFILLLGLMVLSIFNDFNKFFFKL